MTLMTLITLIYTDQETKGKNLPRIDADERGLKLIGIGRPWLAKSRYSLAGRGKDESAIF
jgi:hypothetical protein